MGKIVNFPKLTLRKQQPLNSWEEVFHIVWLIAFGVLVGLLTSGYFFIAPLVERCVK